ncbi:MULTISPECIES: DUF2007 domain-containing protein [Altibacter]|uniref:DUF2007 domain-containing protein n=1 Tax=Altibacter TaxID=1535231 RepID=UPI001E2E2939|nr:MULTISPECIES: DUF2007 domain-containing protein [Altibacter]MCW8980390.1 DUF2007 domain-containing protein [Altibacter sp.]MCW9038574.1 DUF2007 domain-containing protein [Altibacter sp.]
MMKNFKTIAIFTFPSEYTVLRHLLEQQEIRHVFLHETMIGVLPFHSNAFGGIRLQVHEEDIPSAQEIINKLNDTSSLHIV